MISHVHAHTARLLGLDIVAIASRSEERSRRRADELSTRAIGYDDLPAGAQAVVIATPPTDHFDQAVRCLERGASVLIEKPLVATLEQADRLLDLANHFPDRVMYAENLAFAPAFGRWISQVADLGTLGHLSARMEQGPPTWGDFLDPRWGGGVLFDLGIHAIALAVLTGRAAKAGEVRAVSADLSGDQTDELARATLTFESGLSADLIISWRGPQVPQWSFQVASAHDALTLDLAPDVVLERNGTPIPLRPTSVEPPMVESLGYLDQMRTFIDGLGTGTTPWMDVAFARWILEIVFACYESARFGARSTPVPCGCDRSSTPREIWRGRG